VKEEAKSNNMKEYDDEEGKVNASTVRLGSSIRSSEYDASGKETLES